jgi:hypothetical protein
MLLSGAGLQTSRGCVGTARGARWPVARQHQLDTLAVLYLLGGGRPGAKQMVEGFLMDSVWRAALAGTSVSQLPAMAMSRRERGRGAFGITPPKDVGPPRREHSRFSLVRKLIGRPSPLRAHPIPRYQGTVMISRKKLLPAAASRGRPETSDASIDKALASQLERVAEIRVKSPHRITRPTALFVDRSGSSGQSMDLGKRIAALISASIDARFHVYAFDQHPYAVNAQSDKLLDWRKLSDESEWSEGTSIGAPLREVRLSRAIVEQIVIVSGKDEDTPPYFLDEYDTYCRETGLTPYVVILEAGRVTRSLEQRLRLKGAPASGYGFAAEPRSLPNLVGLLGRPSRLELLMDRLETPVPWSDN